MTRMIEQRHTNRQYDQQLRSLKDMLLLMGYQAEQMIADSIRSVIDKRSDFAEQVILRDDTMDRLELDVDRLCNEILALQHPVAGDLRFVITSFKIVRDQTSRACRRSRDQYRGDGDFHDPRQRPSPLLAPCALTEQLRTAQL